MFLLPCFFSIILITGKLFQRYTCNVHFTKIFTKFTSIWHQSVLRYVESTEGMSRVNIICHLIFWEAKLNKGPPCSLTFCQKRNVKRPGVRSKIGPHTKNRSHLYLPINVSNQTLSRGAPDCWCMTRVRVITEKRNTVKKRRVTLVEKDRKFSLKIT